MPFSNLDRGVVVSFGFALRQNALASCVSTLTVANGSPPSSLTETPVTRPPSCFTTSTTLSIRPGSAFAPGSNCIWSENFLELFIATRPLEAKDPIHPSGLRRGSVRFSSPFSPPRSSRLLASPVSCLARVDGRAPLSCPAPPAGSLGSAIQRRSPSRQGNRPGTASAPFQRLR
jgi:hypothetical protein